MVTSLSSVIARTAEEIAMRVLFVALTLFALVACAPVYIPGAAHAPMLEGAGDANVAARIGTLGGQLDVGYALADGFAVRAGGQYSQNNDDDGAGNRFLRGTVGAGWFRPKAHDGDALRLSLHGDVGVGASTGTSTVTFNGGSSSTVRYAGAFVTTGLALELGAETDVVGGAVVLHPAWLHYVHDADSDGEGQDDLAFTELSLVGRAGSEMVKFETQIGAWLPIAGDGDFGVPFPLMISLGLVVDLPGAGRGADSPPAADDQR